MIAKVFNADFTTNDDNKDNRIDSKKKKKKKKKTDTKQVELYLILRLRTDPLRNTLTK